MQKTKLVLAEEGANGETKNVVEIEAEFKSEDFDIFKDFVSESERLSEASWVKEGMPSGLDITIDFPTNGVSGKVRVPNWDDVVVVLHKFRPFGLKDEQTYFYKVAGILARQIDNPDFRAQIQSAKDQYSGKASQNVFRLEANGIILNCEETLDKFLNAREYHRDKNKDTFVQSLEAMFPNIDYIKPILCGLIADRVSAVLYLTSVIQCLLGNTEPLQTRNE
jgi:hypothetical protein